MTQKLAPVIRVDPNKCVSCYQCIHICPVKFCNDSSGDVVEVNHDLCIGCGSCIDGCDHDARLPIDDFEPFINALKEKEKLIAIVAPAVAASFPDSYLRLNGWLKSVGVDAVFDVSFGAELTVKSYLEHVIHHHPKTVIAQPCPALVSFIQIYHPDLKSYLAPADSPMMHTMKMVKAYSPLYKNQRFVIISPCLAKRREFDEVGIGDYNVTYRSLNDYFEAQKIRLSQFPETDFDNPPAERAVLFSSPGGLMETAEREVPGIRNRTRKIEGIHTIYPYLESLEKIIQENETPLIIDWSGDAGSRRARGYYRITHP